MRPGGVDRPNACVATGRMWGPGFGTEYVGAVAGVRAAIPDANQTTTEMYYVLRISLALALSASSLASASAQFELGLTFGRGYFMGDLQNDSDLGPLPITTGKAAYGLYARYDYNDRLAFAASATTLEIAGADYRRANTSGRNLSFFSTIYEVGLAAEYYPFTSERAIAPYLTLGAAYFNHNPQTRFNGRTVALRDLGTEGQGTPGFGPRYSLHRWAVPVGAGVRVAFGESWTIGAEAKLRATFFDHLDDVSGAYVNYFELLEARGALAAELGDRTHELTGGEPRDIPTGTPRGNPGNFDYYMTAQVTVGYRLGSGAFGAGRGGSANRYNKCYSF